MCTFITFITTINSTPFPRCKGGEHLEFINNNLLSLLLACSDFSLGYSVITPRIRHPLGRLSISAHVQAKASRIVFCFSIYWIRSTRNATRFDGLAPKEEDVFAKIKYIVYKILYSLYLHDLVVF
ncbi:unnamed protein product [Cuscuta epithymum]|uniref:Uncharacterized protein n=1 Tax=Cuscuta epithymum TaxID=186058 RepID=A0AAV0EG93_9ASTE|nr:unnamed protein product [Cuscuta epithymum]